MQGNSRLSRAIWCIFSVHFRTWGCCRFLHLISWICIRILIPWLWLKLSLLLQRLSPMPAEPPEPSAITQQGRDPGQLVRHVVVACSASQEEEIWVAVPELWDELRSSQQAECPPSPWRAGKQLALTKRILLHLLLLLVFPRSNWHQLVCYSHSRVPIQSLWIAAKL